jgi:hypothetical protein
MERSTGWKVPAERSPIEEVWALRLPPINDVTYHNFLCAMTLTGKAACLSLCGLENDCRVRVCLPPRVQSLTVSRNAKQSRISCAAVHEFHMWCRMACTCRGATGYADVPEQELREATNPRCRDRAPHEVNGGGHHLAHVHSSQSCFISRTPSRRMHARAGTRSVIDYDRKVATNTLATREGQKVSRFSTYLLARR